MSRVPKAGDPIRFGRVFAFSNNVRAFDDRPPEDSFLRGPRHGKLERVSPYRLFMVWLQIAAMALLMAVSPRAEAIPMQTMALGASLVAGSDGAPCDALSSDKAPTHQHRDYFQCCIFCNAAGRDLSAFFSAVTLGAAHYFVPRTSSDVAYRFANGRNPRVLRWAKAWSPRAPPSFS